MEVLKDLSSVCLLSRLFRQSNQGQTLKQQEATVHISIKTNTPTELHRPSFTSLKFTSSNWIELLTEYNRRKQKHETEERINHTENC